MAIRRRNENVKNKSSKSGDGNKRVSMGSASKVGFKKFSDKPARKFNSRSTGPNKNSVDEDKNKRYKREEPTDRKFRTISRTEKSKEHFSKENHSPERGYAKKKEFGKSSRYTGAKKADAEYSTSKGRTPRFLPRKKEEGAAEFKPRKKGGGNFKREETLRPERTRTSKYPVKEFDETEKYKRGLSERSNRKPRIEKEHSDRRNPIERNAKRFTKDQDKFEGGAHKPKRTYSRESKSAIGFQNRSKVRREKKELKGEESNGKVRLNKYISNAGICSRREADKLIGAGLVSVNGIIITEMGHQVNPGDEVKYNNSRLSTDKKVYVIINKPKDTITTLDDPDKRRIITDLIKEDGMPRIYPVGRLDRNTTGILLLTNDGELAQRLMHPKYEIKKIYKATLEKNIKGEDLWTLTNGVELEDGFIKPDSIGMPDPTLKNEVGIEIHSGRNRIVHRIFEHVGYPLERLDRVWYAGLTKKGLKKGEWRHLEEKEVRTLKKLVKLA